MAKRQLMQPPATSASKRYATLKTHRDPFLRRAIAAANVTIPSLMPPSSQTEGSHYTDEDLITPWQSVGARGLNNLGSKLMLALLPPEAPFFRLVLDATAEKLIKERNTNDDIPEKDTEGAIQSGTSGVEQEVMDEIEQYGIRTTAFETAKQAVCCGNGLLHLDPEAPRAFRLNEYVVKRSGKGKVLEIITQQWLSRAALDPMLEKYVVDIPGDATMGDKDHEDTIALYTWVRRIGTQFHVHQEINDKVIEETIHKEHVNETSWVPLRLTKIDNEDYGRSLVEEYQGDLNSLDMLSQAITQGAAAAAKVLFFTRPGGTTNVKKVAQAPNGAFVSGDAKDITVLQLDKFADFAYAQSQADKIERRLSAVFLLASEMPRDAERVTAEEIRLIANELEDALGGAYSLFAQEFQLPIVRWAMARMRRRKLLPAELVRSMTPKIVTGLEALGRNHDLRKLDVLAQGAQIFGETAVTEYVMVGNWLARRAAALGIDMQGVLRSEEQVQKMRQEQQQREQEAALGPETIRQAGAAAKAQQPQ
jgi:hypothetical protein